MSERSVIFYGINSEFFLIAYKLIEKMYASGEKVLFLCDNDDEVSLYNSKVWTSSKLSFIPSGNLKTVPDEDSKFCAVWFATKICFQNEPNCLMHNGLDVSNLNDLNKFQKIIDIFNTNDTDKIKTRSEIYKKNGFAFQKLWVQCAKGWEQRELS